MEKINFEDQKVYNLLSSGNTVGLFQLESSGMKDALTNMKPNRLEDIIGRVNNEDILNTIFGEFCIGK